MGTVVGIDPGCTALGWAVFYDGILRACGLCSGNTWQETTAKLPRINHRPLTVVVEHPQYYPRSKVDPNSLIKLAFTVGAAVRHFDPTHVVTPTPREWKGQVPKEIHNARVLARLSQEEMRVFKATICGHSLLHNVVDAIGVALWHLEVIHGR